MRRLLAASAVLGVLLVACAERAPAPAIAVPLGDLVRDPESYAAVSVRFRASYVSDGLLSVAAEHLVDTRPPRAGEPSIWVDAPAPEGPCVSTAGDAVWAEEAEISGVFQYAPAGGLGQDGDWTMAMEEALVLCPEAEQFYPDRAAETVSGSSYAPAGTIWT